MRLASLDLNLLVALDRLLAHRSVTEAAREVGVTQPAMSRTLARLRDTFDDPLFVRDGRSLVPTRRALALEPAVRAAVDAAAAAFAPDVAFDPARERGTFTLALGDETQQAFADAILAALWSDMPEMDVRLRRLSVASVRETRRGEVDLALAPDLSALPPSAGAVDLSEYVQRPVYERRFVVVSSPSHPRRRVSLAQYTSAKHIVAGPDASGRGFVDDLLEARGLRRRVAAAVSSFTSAASVVHQTDLLAILPDEVVRTCGVVLVTAKPPFPLPVLPMLLLWHPRHTTDERHRFVRERICEAVQECLEKSGRRLKAGSRARPRSRTR